MSVYVVICYIHMHEQVWVLGEGQSAVLLYTLHSSTVYRVVMNIPTSVIEIDYGCVNQGVVESSISIVEEIENDGDYKEIVVSSSYYCVGKWAVCQL